MTGQQPIAGHWDRRGGLYFHDLDAGPATPADLALAGIPLRVSRHGCALVRDPRGALWLEYGTVENWGGGRYRAVVRRDATEELLASLCGLALQQWARNLRGLPGADETTGAGHRVNVTGHLAPLESEDHYRAFKAAAHQPTTETGTVSFVTT